MSKLHDHARRELERAGMFATAATREDDAITAKYNDAIAHAVLGLVDVFALQGHSGLSASITLDVFNRVARFEALTPLTSAPDEWQDVSYDGRPLWQNRRDSRWFSEDGGRTAYNLDARSHRVTMPAP